MGDISSKFKNFCNALRMSNAQVSTVRDRKARIARQLNSEFRGDFYSEANTLYVGSYGRGTAIHLSDIDLIYVMPYSYYSTYNNYVRNGQSTLLQKVKDVISRSYPNSHIKGDGQVVVVSFTDGIKFEILPVFELNDGAFIYPDTHDGGSWKRTNPRLEIEEFNRMNNLTNKNLKRLCRMVRAWKDKHDVSMSGLLIDTLCYRFIKDWEYRDKGFIYYDWMTRDFFNWLSNQNDHQNYWLAPGSNQQVYSTGRFCQKAKAAYQSALLAISAEENNNDYLANIYWRDIYGTKF